jgi:hypothetical protein
MSHEDPNRQWSVVSAFPTSDRGETAVIFDLDKHGAKLFGDLTGNNTAARLRSSSTATS